MSVYKIGPNPEIMHFITMSTVDWVDIFTKAVYFEILINSLKFCRKEKGLIIHAYVIMANHLHMIVRCSEANGCSEAKLPRNTLFGGSLASDQELLGSPASSQHPKKTFGGSLASDQELLGSPASSQHPKKTFGGSLASDLPSSTLPTSEMFPISKKPRLSQILQDFKRHTATEIFKELQEDNRVYIQEILMNQKSNKNEKFQLWQHDNHPIVIESDKFFYQKLNYIHNNPVKQQYVEAPEHWLYSSARNYIFNDHSVMEVDLID